MPNRLNDAISRCLKDKFSTEGTNCLKFRYDVKYSSEDDSRRIDVRYQFEKANEPSTKQGTNCFTAVVKDSTSDASNSNEFTMHLVVLPQIKEIFKEHNVIWNGHVTKFGVENFYFKDNFMFLEYQPSGNIAWSSLASSDAKTVLRKLAQFHACSLVYLKKISIDNIISKTSPLLANNEVETRMYAAIKTIEAYWPEFKESTTKMRSCVETFRKRLTHLLDRNGQTLKVIALGEPYMKNMHFRCQTNRYGNPERVEDVLFCNFKNCFIGSCGYDLNLFLKTCLNFDALTRERYKLLHCYYEHFSATLKTLNENSIPSWQTILDDVHEFEFIGFYGLLCEMPFCQVKSDLPKCYILGDTRNKEIVPISFEQEYEIILKTSHIEEIFKYGLYRFNELRVWNSNIDWEGKQENVDEFVKLNAPIN